MGKQVTVLPGFTDVPLPQSGNPNKPFSAGQTATLTDAEYAALPASITRCLGTATNVAEPARPSTDANANNSPNIVAAATGNVSAKSGLNVLTLTGNITLAFPTTATVGSALTIDLVLKQDATGSRTLTLPASAKAPGGTAVVLSTGANAVDYLRYLSVDGGATWLLVSKQLNIS